MRFAFYGRVSTEDQQDPQASKAWQLSRARSLIEPAGGEIVAEFFDIGLSRSLPWKRRPEALRPLDTIKSPGRNRIKIRVRSAMKAQTAAAPPAAISSANTRSAIRARSYLREDAARLGPTEGAAPADDRRPA